MNEVSYVVVFPTVFSKNKIPQLITNIKAILKIKNQKFESVKRDGNVILVKANDPVFSSSAINLLFGIEKTAIARQTRNSFQEIVSEITAIGGNLILKGEKFLVKVEGVSKGFFTKDVELSATSMIIEKNAKIDAKPGTEENYDKLLYTYLTRNNAYVCIFSDKGQRGIPLGSKNQNVICGIYDAISAISCFETIKQGFNSKIIVCYRQKSELVGLVKILNQIIPRLVKQKVDIEFFYVKASASKVKNYLVFVNLVLDILLSLAKENKIPRISLALSTLIFPVNFIDNSVRRVFENSIIPIIPLSGADSNIFEMAREIGLGKYTEKLERLGLHNTRNIPDLEKNSVDEVLKSRRKVTVNIGPNNVHDILDSLEEKH